MSINTKRWAQKKEDVSRKLKERQTGNMWSKIEEGEFLCYIHPQIYPNDKHPHTEDFNFIEVCMHYNLGGKKNGQVCLDHKTNPILSHPILQSFVANREKNAFKIAPKLSCEACEKIESGEIDDTKNKQQLKWVIGLTPVYYRKSKDEKWTKLKFKPRFLVAGPQIFNDYIDKMSDLAASDIDPTDPNAVVFLKLSRDGVEYNTKYTVEIDVTSIRKPVKLDKEQRAILAKVVKPKGDLDLFKIVAHFTKSPNQISALIVGAETTDDGESAEMPRECYGKSWADDDECRECETSEACAKACGVAPKRVEAKKATDKKLVRGTKQKEPEPPEEPEFETQMDCFANYDEADEACKACDEAEYCLKATPTGELPMDEEEVENNDPESDSESDGLPNCYRQYDSDDEACADCDVKEECEADSVIDDSNSQAEPESESEEEDPDVANIAAEAERLANKNRGRGKGKK
jgi:hypothetical protein